MNARLRPIGAQIVRRPDYDNSMLGFERDWIEDNSALLERWWKAGEHIDGEFGLFCRSQHDIELTRREDFKQTAYAFDGAI